MEKIHVKKKSEKRHRKKEKERKRKRMRMRERERERKRKKEKEREREKKKKVCTIMSSPVMTPKRSESTLISEPELVICTTHTQITYAQVSKHWEDEREKKKRWTFEISHAKGLKLTTRN